MLKYIHILSFLLLFSMPAYAQLDFTKEQGSRRDPVEITSDSLTIYQKENRAVFTGNVLAVQGDVTLRAKHMTVFYRIGDDATAKNASSKVKGKTDLTKIYVQGDVYLTMPNKSAQSQRALYDVDRGVIVMDKSVRLAQGEHLLEGERFVYNVNTGKSQMFAGTKTTEGKPSTGRVKGRFIPKAIQKDEESNQKKPLLLEAGSLSETETP